MKIQVLLAALLCCAMTVEVVAMTAAQRKKLNEAKAAKDTRVMKESSEGGNGGEGRETVRGGGQRAPIAARAAVCLPANVQAVIDADPEGAGKSAEMALARLGLRDADPNPAVDAFFA